MVVGNELERAAGLHGQDRAVVSARQRMRVAVRLSGVEIEDVVRVGDSQDLPLGEAFLAVVDVIPFFDLALGRNA